MDLSLKLGLLSVAATATVVALIFETVHKNKSGLNRLTSAGWISLVLLLASTGLGIGQEFYDRAESVRLAVEKSRADARSREAEQTIQQLKDTPQRLETMQSDLARAEQRNIELQSEVAKLTGSLQTAQSEVEKAHSQLKQARDARDQARRAIEDLPATLRGLLNGLPQEVKELLGLS